jgi:hypothetical protein
VTGEIDRPPLHLELVVSRTPDGRLTGTVCVPEGEARRFSGTMDLVAALEAVLAADVNAH